MVLLRALVARFWREPYQRRARPVGHGAARPLAAAALTSPPTFATSRRISRARAIAFEPAWFEPFVEFRFPRYGTVTYDGVTRRAAAGDRAVARAGRGGERHRHGALRRLVGRAPAGQGDGHDRRASRGHLQRPRGAARVDRRARRIRRRRALSRVEPAVGAASDDRRPGAARRSISSTPGRSARSAAARITSRIPAAATTTTFPGQCQRSRGAPRRALLGARATRRDRCTSIRSRRIRRRRRRSTCAGNQPASARRLGRSRSRPAHVSPTWTHRVGRSPTLLTTAPHLARGMRWWALLLLAASARGCCNRRSRAGS